MAPLITASPQRTLPSMRPLSESTSSERPLPRPGDLRLPSTWPSMRSRGAEVQVAGDLDVSAISVAACRAGSTDFLQRFLKTWCLISCASVRGSGAAPCERTSARRVSRSRSLSASTWRSNSWPRASARRRSSAPARRRGATAAVIGRRDQATSSGANRNRRARHSRAGAGARWRAGPAHQPAPEPRRGASTRPTRVSWRVAWRASEAWRVGTRGSQPGEVAPRVDRDALAQHLEMQVRPGRAAGRSDQRDRSPGATSAPGSTSSLEACA